MGGAALAHVAALAVGAAGAHFFGVLIGVHDNNDDDERNWGGNGSTYIASWPHMQALWVTQGHAHKFIPHKCISPEYSDIC